MDNKSKGFEQELIEAKNKIKKLKQVLQEIADCVGSPDINPSGDLRLGLHCGVEDRDIANRYDAVDFGYAEGVERTLEWAVDLAKHALQTEEVKP